MRPKKGGGIVRVCDVHQRNDADAELIAEAGTVYHETGCTPRQLLQQRDEALKALVYIKLMKDIKNPQYTPELELEARENADTVMRKHESIEEDGR